MKIAIASLARDNITYKGHSLNQVNRFFDQILSQSIRRYADIEVFIEEGDSVDNTYEELVKWRERLSNLHILKYDTNTTQKIASRESQSRYTHLSHIADTLLNYIFHFSSDFNFVFWTEADIIIERGNILEELVRGLEDHQEAGIIAPMVKCTGGLEGKNYDTLAFRDLQGNRWSQTYNPPAQLGRYISMSSIGSTCLMRGELLGKVYFGTGCFMNLCREVREMGLKILVDKELIVSHPTNLSVQERWI